jgi:hypothetical protein
MRYLVLLLLGVALVGCARSDARRVCPANGVAATCLAERPSSGSLFSAELPRSCTGVVLGLVW